MKRLIRFATLAVLVSIPRPAPPPQVLQVPERGFNSSQPGETWEQGLISGNGTIGARVNCRLELVPGNPDHQRFRRNITDLERTADESSLTYRNTYANAYPGSIHVLEGVAFVKWRGGTVTQDGSGLVSGLRGG